MAWDAGTEYTMFSFIVSNGLGTHPFSLVSLEPAFQYGCYYELNSSDDITDYANMFYPGANNLNITSSSSGLWKYATQNLQLGKCWLTNGNTSWSEGTNWSDGSVPAYNQNIAIIAGVTQPVAGLGSVCGTLKIESGASVEVAASGTLTVNGDLVIEGPSGLLVKSGGSLIQNSAGVEATVERDIAAGSSPHGWHLLSAPVAAQAIHPAFTNATPGNYDFYAWWELTSQWVNYKNITVSPTWDEANMLGGTPGHLNFIPGKGYLVSYAAASTKQFSGVLNKDNISVSGLAVSAGDYKGWHLLGNPFTSAITWGTGNWALSNITATAKIWKESTAAYIDLTSGLGIIPSLNGFMVETTGSGALTIPTDARVHNTTTPWYKATDNPKIILQANDPSGQTAQESIIISENAATAGFDPAFDSHFLAGHAPLFYSVAGSDQLSTNAQPEIGGAVQIPFDFIKNNGVNFTIEAKLISNLAGPVILNDLKTNASQDLKVSPVYSFTSEAGDNPNRFMISFRSVGIDDNKNSNSFAISSTGKTIIVNANVDNITGSVNVYNMMGQLMAQQSLSGGKLTKINLASGTGYYLVKVITADNSYSAKVIIN